MVNELFAYITCACGAKFQVLKYDDAGNPIDWDQDATAAEYDAHQPVCPANQPA